MVAYVVVVPPDVLVARSGGTRVDASVGTDFASRVVQSLAIDLDTVGEQKKMNVGTNMKEQVSFVETNGLGARYCMIESNIDSPHVVGNQVACFATVLLHWSEWSL